MYVCMFSRSFVRSFVRHGSVENEMKSTYFDLNGNAIALFNPFGTAVLYRRSLAREGRTFHSGGTNLSLQEHKHYLVQAMDDLQICLNILDSGGTTQHGQKQTKDACQQALDRLEKSYNQLEQQQHSSKTNGNTATDSTVAAQAGVSQQKKDVMRLLLARQIMTPPPKGEAFFLLEWKWWCRWCRRVDFFYESESSQQQGSQERMDRVLKLLPPGAVLPKTKEKEDSDDNDDNDNDDDSSTESDSQQPLRQIDNSCLLPENSIFSKHWYDSSSLRPNLVRGYHYELLPREVYNALRSWYGEVTPSLCRRTTEDGIVVLYHATVKTPPPSSRSHKCSACRSIGATARCKRCMSVQYCDRGCQEAHWPFHKAICKSNSKNNTNNSQKQHSPEGHVGLNNLGNTCFMNSALQCLSHATPLTRHFLSNKFRADVNTSNPLGTGGKLALAYDTVIKEVWMKSKTTAISPTSLKRAIALFAPRFAGCLQHDAQEFLAYLLDGLHEDLNRIRKAPYVEMPDVTDGHNMAIAGAEAWDAHKGRNDSLVMDTFYGQFQSTCVCPKCERISVSFDAFNHVSLEIPQLHKLTVTTPVLVFRAASGDMPYRYGVTLRRQCLVADLKRGLGELIGIPPSRLIICDIYEHSIYELLHDKKPIAQIRPNDVLAAYEVDPYTEKSIHVVATNSLLGVDQDGQEQRHLFGFPFMTSFAAEATCKQVWKHVWKVVGHMASQEGSYRSEDLLKIRVVNSQGQPVQVFPCEDGNATSILPIRSVDKICDHLGKECTENFLFLSLEWENPRGLESSEDKLIDPQSFAAYADHQSLVEAIRQQRSKNGLKGVTLDQCFETFTKPERLDEHNMWYCSKCKEHVRALKTMKLWRLPNILVVHLKRFEFKHALRRDKLDTFVDFPLEGLDMNPHYVNWKSRTEAARRFVDASVPANYDLFAVVNHFGRMGFGHYTAFARRWEEAGMSKEWALFDDSSVRPVVGADGVVSPAAYVLFYRRRTFN